MNVIFCTSGTSIKGLSFIDDDKDEKGNPQIQVTENGSLKIGSFTFKIDNNKE